MLVSNIRPVNVAVTPWSVWMVSTLACMRICFAAKVEGAAKAKTDKERSRRRKRARKAHSPIGYAKYLRLFYIVSNLNCAYLN